MARILIGTFPTSATSIPSAAGARAGGARPRGVLELQHKFRERIEATGARFMRSSRRATTATFAARTTSPEARRCTASPRSSSTSSMCSSTTRPGSCGTVADDHAQASAGHAAGRPGLDRRALLAELTGMPWPCSAWCRCAQQRGHRAVRLRPRRPAPRCRAAAQPRAPVGGGARVVPRRAEPLERDARQARAARDRLVDGYAARATLYMQPTVPGFEYPRSDLPAHVRFIGMLPAEAPSAWTPPAWWHELDGARPSCTSPRARSRTREPQLIAPALEALADEDVLVVVSTGGRPVEQLGLGACPTTRASARSCRIPSSCREPRRW